MVLGVGVGGYNRLSTHVHMDIPLRLSQLCSSFAFSLGVAPCERPRLVLLLFVVFAAVMLLLVVVALVVKRGVLLWTRVEIPVSRDC